MYYLYRITNQINGKIYIGQAEDYKHRWSDHRRAVKQNKPTQIVHHAMIKHGLDNFVFEAIASCKTIEDANELETILVAQYDSFIANGKGYNATLGGMNAPKTEEWKQQMREIKGGWINRKHTAETLAKMSAANLGKISSEETKKKQSDSMKEKCANGWAPKTIFQTGSEATKYWKGKHSSNGFKPGRVLDPEVETRRLAALRAKGSWNKIEFSQSQIDKIKNLSADGLGTRKIAKMTGIARHLIVRVLKE